MRDKIRIRTRNNIRKGLPFTDHALERMSQRGVTPEDIKLVIRHGAESFSVNSRNSYYRIGDKIAKKLAKRGIETEKVKNLVIVVASDGSIVTVYPRSDSGLMPRPKRRKRWNQKRDHEHRVKNGVSAKSLKRASKAVVRRITDLIERQV